MHQTAIIERSTLSDGSSAYSVLIRTDDWHKDPSDGTVVRVACIGGEATAKALAGHINRLAAWAELA